MQQWAMAPCRTVQVLNARLLLRKATRRSSVKAARKSGPPHAAGLQVCWWLFGTLGKSAGNCDAFAGARQWD